MIKIVESGRGRSSNTTNPEFNNTVDNIYEEIDKLSKMLELAFIKYYPVYSTELTDLIGEFPYKFDAERYIAVAKAYAES